MPEEIREQLIEQLADVHAIEEQALVQLRRAPGIVGEGELAKVFDGHLTETETHKERVRGLLEANGALPSAVKDLAGRARGLGMVLSARVNPGTPGKLLSHAYSHEHVELAAYELLARVAERAGAHEAADAALQIAEEERRMAARLEARFDDGIADSLDELTGDDLDEQLNAYLADAHVIEEQATSLLEEGARIASVDELADSLRDHLRETHAHRERVLERLQARGSSPSRVKEIGMPLGGFNVGALLPARPESPAQLAGSAFAFEHLKIAAYEQLRRVAERATDPETATLAASIANEERTMAARIADLWDPAVDATLAPG